MGSFLHRVVDTTTLVFAYVIGSIFATYFALELLFRACKRPSLCRRPKESAYPSLLADPKWGEHKFIVANGIKFHYVEKGKPNLPLMLCLHGFPECWYSWRYILHAFSDSYHVVAVDLRGYGETVKVESSWWTARDCSLRNLVGDVRALITALGYEKCHLVAHDWGGMLAWAFAYAHPKMLDTLTIMNAPHPLAFQDTMSFAQLLRSYYVFIFQLPLAPEIWLSADNYAFIRSAFLEGPMGVRRKGDPFVLKEADVEVYRYIFSRAGVLTSAANYYRNIFGDNARFQREIGVRRSNKLDVRTLIIWGEDDGALGKESPLVCKKYCPDVTVNMIPNASHWVQQDAVHECVRSLADFLQCSTRPLTSLVQEAEPIVSGDNDAPTSHSGRKKGGPAHRKH